jgi:hypothetical protein
VSGIDGIAPAAGIDPNNSVLVATPDYGGDSTTFGANTAQAVVEWDSAADGCAPGQMDVVTGYRLQVGTSAVDSVNLTLAEEPFSFVIP